MDDKERAKFTKLFEEADVEFDKDGGLEYTTLVLKSIEQNDMLFNRADGCVKLCLIIHRLLQEIAVIDAQLTQAGTKVVPYTTPKKKT